MNIADELIFTTIRKKLGQLNSCESCVSLGITTHDCERYSNIPKIIKNICEILDTSCITIDLNKITSDDLVGVPKTYRNAHIGLLTKKILEIKNKGIIFLDNYHKLEKTSRGNEIVNTLIHLLDGSALYNKYLQKEIDLSKILFVFNLTCDKNNKVIFDPILLDRIPVIDYNSM